MEEQIATNETVGSVAALWRFPVKSMRGERIEQAEITVRGLVGDRAYALIEADTGKVVSAKSVRHFPDLLGCRAEFVEPPQMGLELPPVRITLPDGTVVRSDSNDVDRALSAYFRREVRLASAAPDDFTIDMYLTDVEGADSKGRKDTVVEQKLGSAYVWRSRDRFPCARWRIFRCVPAECTDDFYAGTAERASAPDTL